MIELPQFNTKKELFKFMVNNKGVIVAQKKSAIKYADSFNGLLLLDSDNNIVDKANVAIDSPPDILPVKVAINTTNLMDSHDDVHLKGIWNQSLKENKSIMHLQEHSMSFDKIISDSDNVKASAKDFTWKELGFNFSGTTQALIFDSNVDKARNEFMHEQYAKGFVKNHSVGMQYVKLSLAINDSDEDFKAEFEVWNKYISEIANKEVAEGKGYFWAIHEAKIIEGSAVPMGSNFATPTINNNVKSFVNAPYNESGKSAQSKVFYPTY